MAAKIVGSLKVVKGHVSYAHRYKTILKAT